MMAMVSCSRNASVRFCCKGKLLTCLIQRQPEKTNLSQLTPDLPHHNAALQVLRISEPTHVQKAHNHRKLHHRGNSPAESVTTKIPATIQQERDGHSEPSKKTIVWFVAKGFVVGATVVR